MNPCCRKSPSQARLIPEASSCSAISAMASRKCPSLSPRTSRSGLSEIEIPTDGGVSVCDGITGVPPTNPSRSSRVPMCDFPERPFFASAERGFKVFDRRNRVFAAIRNRRQCDQPGRSRSEQDARGMTDVRFYEAEPRPATNVLIHQAAGNRPVSIRAARPLMNDRIVPEMVHPTRIGSRKQSIAITGTRRRFASMTSRRHHLREEYEIIPVALPDVGTRRWGLRLQEFSISRELDPMARFRRAVATAVPAISGSPTSSALLPRMPVKRLKSARIGQTSESRGRIGLLAEGLRDNGDSLSCAAPGNAHVRSCPTVRIGSTATRGVAPRIWTGLGQPGPPGRWWLCSGSASCFFRDTACTAAAVWNDSQRNRQCDHRTPLFVTPFATRVHCGSALPGGARG